MTDYSQAEYFKEKTESHPSQTKQSIVSQSTESDKKSAGAFRTISEVSELLEVPQHVLRFWETKFTQVKPLKRGGGRRYYRPEDIAVLDQVYDLLYNQGYTIKGAQKLLRGHGKSQVANGEFKKEQLIQASKMAPDEPVAGKDKALSPSRSSNTPGKAENTQAEPRLSSRQKTILSSMLGELKELRDMVQADIPEEEDEPESSS